jgi:hypothetical protein
MTPPEPTPAWHGIQQHHFIQTLTFACSDPGAIQRRPTHGGARPRHLCFSTGTAAATIDLDAKGVLSAGKTNSGNKPTRSRQTNHSILTHRRLLPFPHPGNPLQRHPWTLISNSNRRFTILSPSFFSVSYGTMRGCRRSTWRGSAPSG